MLSVPLLNSVMRLTGAKPDEILVGYWSMWGGFHHRFGLTGPDKRGFRKGQVTMTHTM